MQYQLAALVVMGALSTFPVAGVAAAANQADPGTKSSSPQAPASHATTGTVKSIDDATLVITRAGKKGGEMAFTLNTSTTRQGTPAVGSPVSVRYREDGKTLIATAITVQHAKHPADAATPAR